MRLGEAVGNPEAVVEGEDNHQEATVDGHMLLPA